MDTDDLEPLKTKAKLKDLDELSIEALGDYVETLRDEIKRAEAAMQSKKSARAGADAFFKS